MKNFIFNIFFTLFCSSMFTTKMLYGMDIQTTSLLASPLIDTQDLDRNLFDSQNQPNLPMLKKMLEKYYVSLTYLKQTCEFCLHDPKALNQFDPHGGDTCCESRALFIADFFSKNLDTAPIQAIIASIDTTMHNIHTLMGEKNNTLHEKLKQTPHNSQNIVTFDHFLSHHQLKQPLITKNLKYLQLCYFLTKIKTTSFDFNAPVLTSDSLKTTFIDLKKNPGALGLGANAFKELVKAAQANLSSLSVQHIQKQVTTLSSLSPESIDDLQYALGNNGVCLQDGIDGKKVAAYFPLIKLIYTKAVESDIPIVLKVIKLIKDTCAYVPVCQLYKPHKDISAYHATDNPLDYATYKDKPALVLEAFSFDGSYEEFEQCVQNKKTIPVLNCPENETMINYCHTLKKINLLPILWADATMHPQFAHAKDDDIEKNNVVFTQFQHKAGSTFIDHMKTLQQEAQQIGCCKKNMQLFYLKHISAGIVKNHIIHQENHE